MAYMVYKPGTAHNIKGVMCDIARVEQHQIQTHLDSGWFKSPAEAEASLKPEVKTDTPEVKTDTPEVNIETPKRKGRPPKQEVTDNVNEG